MPSLLAPATERDDEADATAMVLHPQDPHASVGEGEGDFSPNADAVSARGESRAGSNGVWTESDHKLKRTACFIFWPPSHCNFFSLFFRRVLCAVLHCAAH